MRRIQFLQHHVNFPAGSMHRTLSLSTTVACQMPISRLVCRLYLTSRGKYIRELKIGYTAGLWHYSMQWQSKAPVVHLGIRVAVWQTLAKKMPASYPREIKSSHCQEMRDPEWHPLCKVVNAIRSSGMRSGRLLCCQIQHLPITYFWCLVSSSSPQQQLRLNVCCGVQFLQSFDFFSFYRYVSRVQGFTAWAGTQGSPAAAPMTKFHHQLAHAVYKYWRQVQKQTLAGKA